MACDMQAREIEPLGFGKEILQTDWVFGGVLVEPRSKPIAVRIESD